MKTDRQETPPLALLKDGARLNIAFINELREEDLAAARQRAHAVARAQDTYYYRTLLPINRQILAITLSHNGRFFRTSGVI